MNYKLAAKTIYCRLYNENALKKEGNLFLCKHFKTLWSMSTSPLPVGSLSCCPLLYACLPTRVEVAVIKQLFRTNSSPGVMVNECITGISLGTNFEYVIGHLTTKSITEYWFEKSLRKCHYSKTRHMW